MVRRIFDLFVFCVLTQLPWIPQAQAAQAYAITCCNVPSSVSVIDRSSHRTLSTLITGQGSAFVALTADNKTMYVANQTDQSIAVLDTATGVQTATMSLSAYGARPFGEFVLPDGIMYVTAGQGQGIYVLGIDTSDNTVLFDAETQGTYLKPFSPADVPPPAMSSDGKFIYILAQELIVFNVETQLPRKIAVPSGDYTPKGVAVTPDGNFAAITYNGGNYFKENNGQFAVIDLHANSVVKQISFDPSDNIGSVALSPDGSLAYFPVNSSSGTTVQVYSFSGQSIVKTFSQGPGTGVAIAVSPDGSQLELGESGANVLCLDAETGSVIAQSGTLGTLVSLTISSDGSLMFVPNFASSMVQVIDPQTAQIASQIPAGSMASDQYDYGFTMAVSANGKKIVVAGYINLTFVDTVHKRVIGTVPFSGAFASVALSAQGDKAYALMNGPTGLPEIQVIDVASLTVTNTLSLTSDDRPFQSAVSPDGSTLCVGEQFDGEPELLTIDLATMTIGQRIPLGNSEITPGAVVVAEDNATVYVEGLYFSGGVSVVNLTSGQVVNTIPAGYGGPQIQLTRNQKYLYEIAGSTYSYYLINLATGQAIGVSGGTGFDFPSDIAVSPDGRLVYITNAESSSLVAFSSDLNGTAVALGSINLPSNSDAVVFSPF